MFIEQVQPTRSSLSDARGTIQLGYDTDSGSEKQDRDDEKTTLRRQTSVDNVARAATIARQHSRDNTDGELVSRFNNRFAAADTESNNKKPQTTATSFATLANPTTWQQQQTVHHQQIDDIGKWKALFG